MATITSSGIAIGFVPLAVLACCAAVGILGADERTGATTAGSQNRAQSAPEIERQRVAADGQARRSLDKDAVAVLEETRKAIELIAQGKRADATAALERASGKIAILTGRNPAAALLPVEYEVEIIETAPVDVGAIRMLADEAERAVKDRDFPAARMLLASLVSEIRVRTHHLPLGTYPTALHEAARLLGQRKPAEAGAVLQSAVNGLTLIDRVTPLPLVRAKVALADARAHQGDREQASISLDVADLELQLANELGYARGDSDTPAPSASIVELSVGAADRRVNPSSR